ncbi:MAG: hypothetical protein AAF656_13940 [Planctomycetota bacterium]
MGSFVTIKGKQLTGELSSVVLDKLTWQTGMELQLYVENNRIIIEPTGNMIVSDDKFHEIVEEVFEKYDDCFRKLADMEV